MYVMQLINAINNNNNNNFVFLVSFLSAVNLHEYTGIINIHTCCVFILLIYIIILKESRLKLLFL